MSEWNNLKSEQKYDQWKKLREEVTQTDLEEALQTTAKFFFSVPISTRYLDFYTPDTWPSPWEILHEGLYCKNTVSLLIYHTISMTHKDVELEMLLVDDDTDRYIIPRINQSYILNFEPGNVNKYQDIKNKIKIVSIIPPKDITKFS